MIHTFEAEFPKPAGSRLGIQLSLVNTPDREGLVVEKVAEGGAVDAYNKKSPEGYRVQEGDLVVKVNGVAADGPLAHHMPAIAGKVMEASTIRLEVRRYCAGPTIPAGGPAAPSKSPNLLPPPNFQDPPGGWTAAPGMSQPGADTDTAGQNAMGRQWKGMQGQTTPFLGMDPSNAPDSMAGGQVAVVVLRAMGVLQISDLLTRALIFIPLFLSFLMSAHRASVLPEVKDGVVKFLSSKLLVSLGNFAFPIFVVHGPLGQVFYKKVIATKLFGGTMLAVVGPQFFYVYLATVMMAAWVLQKAFLSNKQVSSLSGKVVEKLSKLFP